MKKRTFILTAAVLTAAFLGILFFGGETVSAKKALSPLQVKGTKLVNKNGVTVTLKGVSTHGIAWFPQYVNKACFKSFKKMGANTIRLAFYSDPNAGYSESLYNKIEEGVAAATDAGMYVIIDWHILSDGNPKTYQKNASKFFRHFASKYKNYTNVIYEICNEPNGNITWDKEIKPYAQKMISLIRQYDKDAVIIVGTPTWSQDVDIVADNPITGQKNIMYAFHFYAATHKDWIRKKGQTALKKGLPIIVSEFSICDASGNGGIDKKEGTKWMKFLKKNKIGHIAWSVCNKNETASFIKPSCQKTGKLTKKDLTKTGKWIVNNW